MKPPTRTRGHRVTSMSRRRTLSQCAACGRYFASVEKGFDLHRVGSHERGTRRCMSTEELASAGFVADGAGVLRLAQPTKERRMRVRAASGAA